jgi:hypothetical protein
VPHRIRVQSFLLLCLAAAPLTGCLIHYQYNAKIIEVRLHRGDDPANVWSAIDTAVASMGYGLSSIPGPASETRSSFRPLRFFSPASTIVVQFDKKLDLFRVKKVCVEQTKGASSWDLDSHIAELRDKLAEMLPGLTLTIVTIRAEGQADLFPLGDYTPFRKSALSN